MPTKKGHDMKGFFYRWGNQKKYYFNPMSQLSMNLAKAKADRQGRAIEYSRYFTLEDHRF